VAYAGVQPPINEPTYMNTSSNTGDAGRCRCVCYTGGSSGTVAYV